MSAAAALAPEQSVDEVRESLSVTEKGQPANTIGNCRTVFCHDPLLRDAIRLNLLTDRVDIVRDLGWRRNTSALTDTDVKYNHSQKLLSFRYNIDTNRVEARFTDGSAVANRMPNCLRTSSTRYFTVGLTRRIECHRFFMATAENHCNVFCVTNWSSE